MGKKITESKELGVKIGDEVRISGIVYKVGNIIEGDKGWTLRLDRPSGAMHIMKVPR